MIHERLMMETGYIYLLKETFKTHFQNNKLLIINVKVL